LAAAIVAAFEAVVKINLLSATMLFDRAAYRSAEKLPIGALYRNTNSASMGAVALILIIDDDGFYRGLIERALSDEGHQVLAAHSAVEGIASYQERRPDLVITDMRMPSIGGAEVIRSLRKFDARVKIIAVSGEASFYDKDLFKLAKEAGADAILRKLDPIERVVIEVNTLLGASV
jgi:CheY-like chemotaxis protein